MLYRINSNGFDFCGQVSEFAYHFLFTSVFIGAVRVPLKSYTYITHMYIFPLFDIMGKLLYISGYILPLLVSLGSTVTQNIIFFCYFFLDQYLVTSFLLISPIFSSCRGVSF